MEATQENLKVFVKYDPFTGDFRRIARRSWKGNIYSCDFEPKSITTYGYLQMNIFGRSYVVHRLIFLYMTGQFPENDVDHINGDRLDNRWVNLRTVDRQTNLRNIGIGVRNTTGHLGVYLRKDTGKFDAYIGADNKRIKLGCYVKFEDAVAARQKAEIEIGFHHNHGKRLGWAP